MSKYIKYDDAPESWSDRCSGDGHKRVVDEKGVRTYADNGDSVGLGYRACACCNEFPTEEGHDACLGELGKVINACCGHGTHDGYIMFENGLRISGKLIIENIWEEEE